LPCRDEQEALRLLEGAAQKGHSKAQFNLAKRLLTGDGIEKNEHRARMLLMSAADNGETKAARTLRLLKKDPPKTRPGEAPAASAVAMNTLPTEGVSEKGERSPNNVHRPSIVAVARAKAAVERRKKQESIGSTVSSDSASSDRMQFLSENVGDENDTSPRRCSDITTHREWQSQKKKSLWVDLRHDKYES